MTKFGWTIIAKGREINYTALLLAQTNQSDYEQLCRLDVLGLEDRLENDQETVYAEFRSCEVKRVGTKLASRGKKVMPPF